MNIVSVQTAQEVIVTGTDSKLNEAKQPSTHPPVVAGHHSNTTKAKTPYRRADKFPKLVTIVTQLSGEMANNLQHIAHSIGLKKMLQEEFGITRCRLVLRHYEGPNNRAPRPKWKSARDYIQECFPHWRTANFEEGNGKGALDRLLNLQRKWLGNRHDWIMGKVNAGNITEIREGLEYMVDRVLKDKKRPWVDPSSRMQLPVLYSQTLDSFPLMDRYYDTIRESFAFNQSACCSLDRPRNNSIVFHFRNYQSEMPDRRAYDMGFAELSPQQAATELFADANGKQTIQITTRIPNRFAREYATALNATLVTEYESHPMHDFCYMHQAQHLVGNARSTFAIWAGYLGSGQVRLYHVNNTGLWQRHPNFWERFTYNWTNPDLRRRVHWELYQSAEERAAK